MQIKVQIGEVNSRQGKMQFDYTSYMVLYVRG